MSIFTLLILAFIFIAGAVLGWIVRAHFAAIERIETNTVATVTTLLHGIELKLGLIQASTPPPIVMPAKSTPAAAPDVAK